MHRMIQSILAWRGTTLSARVYPPCSLRLALIVSTMQTLQTTRYVSPARPCRLKKNFLLYPGFSFRIFSGARRAAPQARQVRTSLWVAARLRWLCGSKSQPLPDQHSISQLYSLYWDWPRSALMPIRSLLRMCVYHCVSAGIDSRSSSSRRRNL